jgi:hypothetical protein
MQRSAAVEGETRAGRAEEGAVQTEEGGECRLEDGKAITRSDAFGHSDYAAAAAAILLEEQAPLTVGLFGPWGVGKTWIVERIEELLSGRVAFAYFDAWRYEGDALRRQFLRDLGSQLHPDEADFDPESELTDLDESKSRNVERLAGLSGDAFRETAVRVVLAGVIAFLILRVVGRSSLQHHGVWQDFVISGLITLLLFALTPLTRVFRVTEETYTRSRLEDPEQFSERFATLLSKLKKDRLVIAIDNLDRCSPERVEEILSTIKTYLEPVAQVVKPPTLVRLLKEDRTKEAVFLISADDQALRRHLEAKETSASGEQREAKEIAQYVEEYLRKFFTTAIRIRPLLDEDVRAYTSGELQEFAAANELDDETRSTLVEMVAAALSGNPRRVRQFSKNLDARLLVIKERQEEGRIDPPISPQVLVVAKLAILEEEWPASFRVLESDPRLLDQWHRHVIEGTPVDVPDWDDPAFRRFLSTSRTVRADNLGAFIRLKQSQHEIRLARYDEFQTALLQGDYELVEEILEAATEDAHAYAAQLPRLLDEQLTHGYLDAARAVVEGTVSVKRLTDERTIARTILQRAIGEAELRPRLNTVRPVPLFVASRLVDHSDRRMLLAQFVDFQEFLNESPERLEQVIEAFSRINADLPSEIARSVTSALGTEAVATQSKALLPLARANPDLLPPAVATAAIAALVAAFDVSSAAYELMTHWFRRTDVGAYGSQFVTAATQAITAAAAQPQPVASEDLASLFDNLPTALNELDVVPQAAADGLLVALSHPLTLWSQPMWPGVIETAGTIEAKAEAVGTTQATRLVSEFFSAAPHEAVRWSSERGASLPDPLREAVMSQLAAFGVQNQEERGAAVAAIVKVDPTGALDGFRDAMLNFFNAGLFRAPLEAIRAHPELASPHLALFVDTALQRAGAITTEGRLKAAFEFFAELSESLNATQRDELRDLIIQRLSTRDDDAIETAADAVRRLRELSDYEDRLREVVSAAFEQLKTDPQPRSLVGLVAENFMLLTPSERSAFVALLARLVEDPADRALTLRAVTNLPSLEATQREVIVQSLVNAEVLDSAEDERVVLLRTADAVAGSRGKARQILKSRLDELSTREGVDGSVHRRVVHGDPSEPEA